MSEIKDIRAIVQGVTDFLQQEGIESIIIAKGTNEKQAMLGLVARMRDVELVKKLVKVIKEHVPADCIAKTEISVKKKIIRDEYQS